MLAEAIAKPPSDTWISRLEPASDVAGAAPPSGYSHLGLGSCLEELSFDFAGIDCRCAVRELLQLFTQRPLLPGCIILKDRHYLGLISRRYLFEILGRPFGVDLFMERPVSELLNLLPPSLPLAAQAPIAEVAAHALNRPGHLIYEPLAVKLRDGSYGILDAHTLLQGQSHLLRRSLTALRHQLEIAANYMRSLLPAAVHSEHISTAWRWLPSSQLGGDGFGYQWLDDQHFAFFLFDVSGHGIGSALLAVSLIHILRTRALNDIDFRQPREVLAGLNDRFPMRKNIYFTIAYGVFNYCRRSLRYAAAGHPSPVIFQNPTGEIKKITPATRNPAVGFSASVKFQQEEMAIFPPSRLYIFSDGVFEIKTKNGKWLQRDIIVDLLADLAVLPGEEDLDRLENELRASAANPDFSDDFTILRVDFR